MSFKFLLIFIFCSACGVKGPPRNTSDTVFKSYAQRYHQEQLKHITGSKTDTETEEAVKKKK